jgi:nucleoside-diphosphate-sugar epimerase
MRALVTGANGFIGSHLVEHLLERDHTVTCLVRKTSDLRWIEGLRVRFVYGDCRDGDSLGPALREVDHVFHLAGTIRARDRKTYFQTNHIGTRNLVDACADPHARVTRFVYVSSISAAGPSRPGHLKSEEEESLPITDYGRSKLLGEEAVRESGLEWVIIRPPNVLGPREETFLSMARILKGRIKPLIGNGDEQTSICFVGDLVRGILEAALSEKARRQVYYLTDGKTYSWRKITNTTADALGVSGFMIPIPTPLMMAVAVFSEIAASLRSRPSVVSREQIGRVRDCYWTFDGSKAERDFGFKASVDLERGIGDTVDWYRRRKLL